MGYWEPDEYHKGLSWSIGVPNDQRRNPLDKIYREHIQYESSTIAIHSTNYGIDTTIEKEWKGAAGVWTPKERDFSLDADFALPAETKEGLGHHAARFVSSRSSQPTTTQASWTTRRGIESGGGDTKGCDKGSRAQKQGRSR